MSKDEKKAVTMQDVELARQIADEDKRAEEELKLEGILKKYAKKRYWAFISYPDSLPADWQDRLMQTGLACAVSPLHDSDVQADGKTPKKPHFHNILIFNGPTSFNVVKRISKDLLNGTLPIPLECPRGYYRYFTHLDSPDKYQYDAKAITHINGFDVGDFLDMTKSEVLEIKKRLLELIIENDFLEYWDFMEYLLFNGSSDEFDIASTNTIFFNSALKSRRHRAKENT